MNFKLGYLLTVLIFVLQIQAQEESKGNMAKQLDTDTDISASLDELISQIKAEEPKKEIEVKENETQDLALVKDQVLSAAQKAKSSLEDAKNAIEDIISQLKPKEKLKLEEKEEDDLTSESESKDTAVKPSEEKDDILKMLSQETDVDVDDVMDEVDL